MLVPGAVGGVVVPVELREELCRLSVLEAGESVEFFVGRFGRAVFEFVDYLEFELDEDVLLGGEGLCAAELGGDEGFDGGGGERVVQFVIARDFGDALLVAVAFGFGFEDQFAGESVFAGVLGGGGFARLGLRPG